MRLSNKEIGNQANISTISEQIYRWRWNFIGHILRMDPNKHPKTALKWAPEGKRSHGRPKETWSRIARKKEQHWVLRLDARQQWLLETVWHGKGECPALYPPRVMVLSQVLDWNMKYSILVPRIAQSNSVTALCFRVLLLTLTNIWTSVNQLCRFLYDPLSWYSHRICYLLFFFFGFHNPATTGILLDPFDLFFLVLIKEDKGNFFEWFSLYLSSSHIIFFIIIMFR